MTDPTTPKIHKLVDPETGQPVHLVYAIPPELLTGGTPADEGINLYDLMQRLWRGRLWVICGTVLGAVVGTVLALSRPDVYTSEVIALPPNEKGGGNIAQLAGMAAVAGVSLPVGESTSRDTLTALLDSRTLHEILIKEFNLAKYYGRVNAQDRTLRDFRNDWKVDAPKTVVTIAFSYTNEDPEVAAAVVNRASESLRELFTQMQQEEASRERMFLEERLRQVEKEWKVASDAMAIFMRKNQTVEIEAQTEATVAALGTLQGQLIASQIELKAQRTVGIGDENPMTQLLEERVRGLEAEIARLLGSSTDGALIGLEAIPAIGQEYLMLLRETKRQESLLVSLIAQVEAAKLTQVREAKGVAIVDHGRVPDLKSGPKRALIVLVYAVVGGFAGLLGAYMWGVRRLASGNSPTE